VKFLLDHDVADRVGDVLREDGHSVILLRDVLPINSSDADIVAYANEAQRIVVTCNRQDFLELGARREHYGIIILVRRRSRIAECSVVLKLVQRAGESGLVGNVNFA
jgi:predicted nuclease of predicted toxin-antitoxin system